MTCSTSDMSLDSYVIISSNVMAATNKSWKANCQYNPKFVEDMLLYLSDFIWQVLEKNDLFLIFCRNGVTYYWNFSRSCFSYCMFYSEIACFESFNELVVLFI